MRQSGALLVLASVLSVFAVAGAPQRNPTDRDSNQDSGGCLLFGEHYAFGIEAPTGWTRDSTSGADQGIDAVFYPSNSTWAAFDPVIYPQIWQKGGHLSLSDVIAQDTAAYREHSPGVVIEERPQLRTATGATAAIRHCAGPNGGPYEAIAYFDQADVVVVFILSAKSRERFQAAQAAFRELLDSYKFLGEWERMPVLEDSSTPR